MTFSLPSPLSLLKPAAHGEERAEQTASRGGLLSRFLTVCGELLVRNSPREAVRKKSNMFDIFRLARQIPHCVRPSWESSWAWPMKHPIKIHGILTWLQWRRNFFSDTILNRWSHVSMPCIFIGCLIKPSSARFSRWPHTLRNLSLEAKNIKHVWFYPHGLARRISHHNFPAHVRKRLSKPPHEAVCSALSSSVRRA